MIKKIVHVLALILYIMIGVYTIVCIPILARYHPLVVLSGSMEPTYKEGSILYYKKVLGKNLKEGDVVTFISENGNYVSHRIVSIKDNLITTKGDANNVEDAVKTPVENVQGRVAKLSLPFMGYYVQAINNHLTIAIITSVIILVSEFLLSNLETFGINKKSKENIRSEIEIL